MSNVFLKRPIGQFVLLILVGLCVARCAGAQQENASLSILGDDRFELKYDLPIQTELKNSSDEWGMSAPVFDEISNPNLIRYDEAYMKLYVDFALNNEISCGSASYFIITDDESIEIRTGLDESYLGMRFKAEDLIKFLEVRVAENHEPKTFPFEIEGSTDQLPNAVRTLSLSPWERDLYHVISLLAKSKYGPGYDVIKQLTKDSNETLRYGAIQGLAEYVDAHEPAASDLGDLLNEEHLARPAMEALRRGGPNAIPIIVSAIEGSNPKVANQAVFSLPWIADSVSVAESAWIAALDHEEPEIRSWGMAALQDLCSRGTDVDLAPLRTILEKRQSDDSDLPRTRSRAESLLKRFEDK